MIIQYYVNNNKCILDNVSEINIETLLRSGTLYEIEQSIRDCRRYSMK